MLNIIKLGNSVIEALNSDKVFAEKFENNGYHLEDLCVYGTCNYKVNPLWVIDDNALVFKDFSSDPEWHHSDRRYTHIDISRVFMFDTNVIKNYLFIYEEEVGRWESEYEAYSSFDHCSLDFLEQFCPKKYNGKYNWSKPLSIPNLVSKIFRISVKYRNLSMLYIGDRNNTIELSMFSDFEEVDGSSCFIKALYGENSETDEVIREIVSAIEEIPHPIKEVYFLTSGTPDGFTIARKNPDGELTLTVY